MGSIRPIIQLVVNITGGTLTSQKGNAVTVYNTEKNEVQTAQITVLGGTFEGGKAAITSVTNGDNTVTTDGNTQTTSKVQNNLDGFRQCGSCLH